MAWTAMKTQAVGDPVIAADWNTYVRDNLNETAVAKVTTAGDTVYATGANALARLGLGAARAVLMVNAGATAPNWVAGPSTGFVHGALSGNRHIEASFGTSSSADGVSVTFTNAYSDGPSVVLTAAVVANQAGVLDANTTTTGFTFSLRDSANNRVDGQRVYWIAEGPD